MFQNQQINFPLLIIVGTITFLVFVLGVFILMKAYQRKTIENILEKQQLQSQFAQTLLQSQVEIQEQTLQNISRELHDNLGQVASLIKINLNTIQLSNPEKAAERIEDTKDLTRQLITDIKALSVSLGSDRINQVGLADAIKGETERLNKTGVFTVDFIQEGTDVDLDTDKATILYRMVQEMLNNIVKHSSATQVQITFNQMNSGLFLAVKDNGVGFDVAAKVKAAGAGLRNLRSRATLINAVLEMESNPGQGTNIIIKLPNA